MLELDGALHASGFMCKFHHRGLGLPPRAPRVHLWSPVGRPALESHWNSASVIPGCTTSSSAQCNFSRGDFCLLCNIPSVNWIPNCTGPGGGLDVTGWGLAWPLWADVLAFPPGPHLVRACHSGGACRRGVTSVMRQERAKRLTGPCFLDLGSGVGADATRRPRAWVSVWFLLWMH